jgi:glycerol kinase
MLVDPTGEVVATSSVAVGQHHPQPGWVEQDPAELWRSVQRAVADLVDDWTAHRVVGLALSVQRESLVVWEHGTGRALTPLLGWQDERTRELSRDLRGHADHVFATTGLPLDPMFSALKARWLLDRMDPDRRVSSSGRWRLGTLEAWLLAQFGGESVTELGNASRTQLLGLDAQDWDDSLLDLFGVPRAALPRPVSSDGPFPAVRRLAPLPDGVPVLAVMGDSHAALFAQAGWRPGVVKATYGTGSSVMALAPATGPRPGQGTGVCSTIAWATDGAAVALEANIRSTGRTLTWLAELLGVDIDVLVAEAERSDSGGVTLVPAFGGLGAPWWDPEATPVLAGFALGTQRGHLARAALESVAFQVDDVLTAFGRSGAPLTRLACDGGLTRSAALVQLQADLSGIPVRVAATGNLSALGVAHLAGIGAGWWTMEDLDARARAADEGSDPSSAYPRTTEVERAAARDRWASALARSRPSVARSG